MDDDDDYIVDDIVLDDQTLAALDQQEKQYFAETSTIKGDEPANKRLKTVKGWSPAPPIQKSAIVEDESLPEISLQGDGSYGLSTRFNTPTRDSYLAAPIPKNYHSSTTNNGQSTSAHVHALPTRMYNLTSLPNPVSSRHGQHRLNQSSRTGTPSSKPVGHIHDVPNPETQMLKKTLEQLQADHARLQAELQETKEQRVMKEGEVGVLRRSIEKNNQMHAAQLAQLRQEKHKAELRQAEMQKEIKDEIERLRTQFMFKASFVDCSTPQFLIFSQQQELEATIRKPPATSRTKGISKELPGTPAAFGSTQSDYPSLYPIPEATPQRVTRTTDAFSSRSKAISPQKPATAATLPGFHNAFDTSTPIRSQVRRINKGKDKQKYDMSMDATSFPDIQPLQLLPITPRHSATSELASNMPPFSIPFADHMAGTQTSVQLEDDSTSESLIFEGINWKALMAHLILTYSHPTSDVLLFPRLLSIAQPINSELYVKCCSKILEVVSNPIDLSDFTRSVNVISDSILTLCVLLDNTNEIQLLASILNLTTKLVLAIPNVSSAVLASTANAENLDIISILCKLILRRLSVNNPHEDKDLLASEIILLLESLVLRVSMADSKKIKEFLQNRECLTILLHTSQPTWLLERTVRLLCLVSYHINGDMAQQNTFKNALLDRLSYHLIDSSKSDHQDLKIYILTFFSQLSVAHPDARAALVGSYSLIPSVIIYITHLTTPLWENDEGLIESPEKTLSTAKQAIYLLHHLCIDGSDVVDLRDKLQRNPNRYFTGAFHFFIVSLGRLSYCQPPGWVDEDGKQDLKCISGLSYDILGLVIDGPEFFNIEATFDISKDNENTTDEGDIEARFMGVDTI
ncbi:hypothetical protein CVT24_005156 [Panaeolus cyanescens]|uniref:Uncharacterized protein n=1 Tax=Panaeolus cyanescens TaxID=181874 RepID=A0A409VBY1_9AGAR|nr:hypothetical protein CVT24_005156 [Panaeolus cyanescens]